MRLSLCFPHNFGSEKKVYVVKDVDLLYNFNVEGREQLSSGGLTPRGGRRKF
jgi:hypothetical protein